MSSILTNTSAMTALQTLRTINQDLGRTQDMISTGKRVATAKDNAAVFAISKVMEGDVAGFKAISESLSLGASTVAVASNATDQVGGLLEEIKNKITSANGENVDRNTLQNEISQLRDQITGIVGAAQFNGLNLLQGDAETSILASLDRSSTGAVTSNSIDVQGRDYGTSAGTAGSDLSKKNMALGGETVTGNTLAISIVDGADVMSAGATDEELMVEVDGVQLTIQNADLVAEGIITAGANGSDADVATYVARAINNELSDESRNFNVQGLTATVDTATADATVTITSTASEDVSIQFINDLDTVAMSESLNGATATTVANAATSTERTLSQVNGTVNTPSTLDIEFNDGAVDSFANAADDEFTLTVGDQSFTYTAAGSDTDSDTSVGNIVSEFNQTLDNLGITSYRFEQVDGNDTGSIMRINNFDTTESFDVSFDAADFAGPTVPSQDRPTVEAATAEPLELTFGGNVVEGDSFTVTIGSTTSTYVAGRNETASDVARGLQNVLAADGPAGIVAGLSFNGETNSATLTLTGDVGFEASISEASGGTQSTGDLYGLSTIDVTTSEGAEKAIGTIENLIQINVDAQAEFGAKARRVDLQNDFMSTLIDSFKSGIGALVDTDMEAASARLQALQVQQQLAVQSLSIANQAPQTILSLFR